jgi:hypothetical protein
MYILDNVEKRHLVVALFSVIGISLGYIALTNHENKRKSKCARKKQISDKTAPTSAAQSRLLMAPSKTTLKSSLEGRLLEK